MNAILSAILFLTRLTIYRKIKKSFVINNIINNFIDIFHAC